MFQALVITQIIIKVLYEITSEVIKCYICITIFYTSKIAKMF